MDMNRAIRVSSSTIGAYAGLLGVVHGCFELMQGNVAPIGIVISAIGAPCQRDIVWHACLPAMTVIPNFIATGTITIIASLSTLVWAAAFIQRKNGGLILLLLSIIMLLVGGGFIPSYTGIIAGIVGGRINTGLPIGRTRLPADGWSFLAKLWPWTLAAFLLWSVGGWILGYFFNQAMIDLSLVSFLGGNLGLPLLTVFTACASDIYRSSLGEK